MSSTKYSTVYSHEHDQLSESKRVGVPAPKPRLRTLDVAVVCTSLVCCGIAAAVVQIDYLAWHLGYSYQLVVIGLMLSIMNMCLGYTMPFLLALFEARLGSSILQNYDAILRNTFFGANIQMSWRITILALTALPLGLSAAYKTFSGGQATLSVPSTAYYGLFAPPDMKPIGQNTGLTIMINATLPFLRSTNVSIDSTDGLPLPDFPKAYGLNNLLLSEDAAAALDIPSPDFVTGVQSQLQLGEAWNVTASVMGMVTRQNETINQYRDIRNSNASLNWWNYYLNQVYDTTPLVGRAALGKLFNNYDIWMLNNQVLYDQTWLFLGFAIASKVGYTIEDYWASFAANAYMFSTRRESCVGTWTITRTSMQLVDGFCNTTSSAEPIPQNYQILLENNNLGLDVYFVPTLIEYLGPFSGPGHNTSIWYKPTLSVTVASMLWSRVTALNGPTNTSGEQQTYGWTDPETNEPVTIQNPGLVYRARGYESVTSKRQALRRSPWLFFTLGLQPILTIFAIAIAGTVLYKVPIDKGFGLVSILAGIDAGQDRLQGAALSGKLKKRVGLKIEAVDAYRDGEVKYSLVPEENVSIGRIRKGWTYG